MAQIKQFEETRAALAYVERRIPTAGKDDVEFALLVLDAFGQAIRQQIVAPYLVLGWCKVVPENLLLEVMRLLVEEKLGNFPVPKVMGALEQAENVLQALVWIYLGRRDNITVLKEHVELCRLVAYHKSQQEMHYSA